MAVPKRNHSNRRTATRKANWKLTETKLAVCPNCGAKILPHRICKACGYYNGKQIVNIENK